MTQDQSDRIVTHPNVASNIALLEAWLQSQLAYQSLPGITIGIVHDQTLVYARGFGYADVEKQRPSAPDTIYRIASHSKLFTAISIMQLRDQGKLQLDDPVQKHLPWFTFKNPMPTAPPVTIRHLLTHTSGLPREAGSGYWIDFIFPTAQDIKERLPDLKAAYASESRWKYSNLALAVAGEIVEVVADQSYATYVENNILTPLDMSSTSVVFPSDHQDRLATGYGRRLPDGSREVFPFVDAEGLAAATGISSTVEDMARFLAWQHRLRSSEETEVLKASTLREMQRVHWMKPDWQSGWGLGFSIKHLQDRDLIGHGGGYPGYLTDTQISPEEEVGVIVFTNALDAVPGLISSRIFEWIAPAIHKSLTDDIPEAANLEWKKYEGSYRSIWSDSHVLILDGKLSIISPTASNPKEMVHTLEPVSDHTFILEGMSSGALGEPVVFHMDSNGNAEGMTIGVVQSVRVN